MDEEVIIEPRSEDGHSGAPGNERKLQASTVNNERRSRLRSIMHGFVVFSSSRQTQRGGLWMVAYAFVVFCGAKIVKP